MPIVQYQMRRNVSTLLTQLNETVPSGEPVFELDTKKFKFGNGTTAWNSLNYPPPGSQGSNTNVQFNDSSNANGSAGFVFNKTANNLSIGNTVNAASYTIGSFLDVEPTFIFHSGNANTAIMSVGVASPSAYLHIKAGTATNAPLKLDSGTRLTTPEVGAVEYNGVTAVITPSSGLGKTSLPLTTYTSGSVTPSSTTTSAPIFPSTQDTISLSTGTYLITLGIRITFTGSTTNALLQLDFLGTGTAVGSLSWFGRASGTDGGASSIIYAAATALGTVIPVSTSLGGTRQYVVTGQGILRITTAGTVVPSTSVDKNLASLNASSADADNYLLIQQLDTQSATVYGPMGSGWG